MLLVTASLLSPCSEDPMPGMFENRFSSIPEQNRIYAVIYSFTHSFIFLLFILFLFNVWKRGSRERALALCSIRDQTWDQI